MKTFDDEYRNLLIWYKEKLDDAKKLPNGVGLDDGQRCRQERLIDNEYRRRLRALQEKYKDKTA